MNKLVLLTLLASFLSLSVAACTVAPTGLHPVAGTREGSEQFKDDSTN